MAKVWTYIPLWKSRGGALETSNTPFSDWHEFCAEYGATVNQFPVGVLC